MPAKRKRSESSKLAADLSKRNHNSKRKTDNKAAPGTRQSLPLQMCLNLTRVVDKENHFKQLSDDIIVCHILSRLSLREAVTTSALSHRWRNLWTASIGSKLIFSYPTKEYSRSRLRPILARGISRILEVVKPKFDELTIRFDFNSTSCFEAINKWVQIALANKVTWLHLDFSPPLLSTIQKYYTFPAIHELSASPAINASVKYSGIHDLRDVCFKSINVSSEVIECMLSNCPSLERLVVWGSTFQQKIRVCTQSSKLKSLEFVNCHYERIDISSPNLIYLRYSGFEQCLQLDHVPLLSELSLGFSNSRSFLGKSAPLFMKYIPQLKRLKLEINYSTAKNSVDKLLEFPQLVKLEQLEVKLVPGWWSSHHWVIMLIKAAPSLQKFSIKLDRGEMDTNPDEEDYHKNLLNIIRRISHPSLKLIEMLKFSGTSLQIELGQHLLSISPLLEQFVVSRYYRRKSDLYDSPVPVAKYRIQAQKFNEWLPPTAKLVIL